LNGLSTKTIGESGEIRIDKLFLSLIEWGIALAERVPVYKLIDGLTTQDQEAKDGSV